MIHNSIFLHAFDVRILTGKSMSRPNVSDWVKPGPMVLRQAKLTDTEKLRHNVKVVFKTVIALNKQELPLSPPVLPQFYCFFFLFCCSSFH